jgi:hypothetical protein
MNKNKYSFKMLSKISEEKFKIKESSWSLISKILIKLKTVISQKTSFQEFFINLTYSLIIAL